MKIFFPPGGYEYEQVSYFSKGLPYYELPVYREGKVTWPLKGVSQRHRGRSLA